MATYAMPMFPDLVDLADSLFSSAVYVVSFFFLYSPSFLSLLLPFTFLWFRAWGGGMDISHICMDLSHVNFPLLGCSPDTYGCVRKRPIIYKEDIVRIIWSKVMMKLDCGF